MRVHLRPGPRESGARLLSLLDKEGGVRQGIGKGLSIRLNSFETHMQPEHSQPSGNRPHWADGVNWQLADLDVPQGYMAAVAVETGMDRLVYFEWRSGITQ